MPRLVVAEFQNTSPHVHVVTTPRRLIFPKNWLTQDGSSTHVHVSTKPNEGLSLHDLILGSPSVNDSPQWDGTDWVPATGGGAPTDADYLVGTANGSLSAEIVVGTSPGGELGGTWASPTIDDSLAVTSWNLTTPTITTSLTTSTPTTLTAAELDRLDGLTSPIIDDDKIDTYSELNTIVADATLTHNGLIDTYSELNTIVTDATLTHNGLIDTFAELDTIVADKALVNKADGAVWLGVHDFGGATSTEIVNGTNPTTDAAGEIAIDTNHSAYGALEIYGATGSAIIPALHKAAATIYDPDTIQATEDAIPLLFVADDWAPHGITIVDIHLSADASNSGSYALEEWTSPTALGSTIETVAFSAATTAEDDGTLADSAVATNAWVFLNLDTTALNFLHVEFTYIVNEGA